MSRSLIRKNQLHPDIADLVGEYGSGYFVPNDRGVVFTNQTANFSISNSSNNKIILANSSTLITGELTTANASGFNTSIIQIGNGQIAITGQAGVTINSYVEEYRTAGRFATIALLHTGNNGYIMYGNTSS
jgi:hypothetical protein